MPRTPAPNPNVPAMPEPLADVSSLTYVVKLLRQGVESLGGHRGGSLARAVTLEDLVVLGLVTEAELNAVMK